MKSTRIHILAVSNFKEYDVQDFNLEENCKRRS